jgi:hypothetical protein
MAPHPPRPPRQGESLDAGAERQARLSQNPIRILEAIFMPNVPNASTPRVALSLGGGARRRGRGLDPDHLLVDDTVGNLQAPPAFFKRPLYRWPTKGRHPYIQE